MRSLPQYKEKVYVTERPTLVGEVEELVSSQVVKVRFDGIEDLVTVSIERLSSLR